MTNKIAVLGSGAVGDTLANGFVKHGYSVMRGSRDPNKLKWSGEKGTFEQAAAWGEVVVIAVKGTAAEPLVKSIASQLAGKVVIDTNNPIGDVPPTNGVLNYFTGPNDSLMERLQKAVPTAKFVKAFNSVGNALMVNPNTSAMPTMFICGNDAGAKDTAREILTKFGWETCDCGSVEAARPIEALCQLWCIPGFVRNDWAHAFKMVYPV